MNCIQSKRRMYQHACHINYIFDSIRNYGIPGGTKRENAIKFDVMIMKFEKFRKYSTFVHKNSNFEVPNYQ